MKKSVHFLKKIVLCFLLLELALQPAISQVYAVTEKQLTELELSSRTQEEQLETLQKQLKEAEKSLKTLNVEVLDFYHIWAVMNYDQYKKVISKNGLYEGALKA